MSPILRRLLSLILSLAVASAVIFAVVDLVPGDPASFMLGTGAQPDTVAALREQMWSNLQSKPTHTAQTGPHLPVQMPRGFAPGPPTSSSSLMSSPTSTASGSYRTISEQREGSVPRSDRTPASADDGWPLGYIVASAFFLAIAVVGFSLWLALEVISL